MMTRRFDAHGRVPQLFFWCPLQTYSGGGQGDCPSARASHAAFNGEWWTTEDQPRALQ